MFADLGLDDTAGVGFLVAFLIGFAVLSILMSVVGSAVNTVIVCFSEAPREFEMNHSSTVEYGYETGMETGLAN